jgi:hypothetical protein
MIRRYDVITKNTRTHAEFATPNHNIVWAYNAKDAFEQIDCIIDKSTGCSNTVIIEVKPFPLTLKERIKFICQ